ncbi:MAG: O-antigen ligase [Prolixibacteraceae bacterium]|nr:O-antigen ligase [Prolixibacteraceae bacterium]
MPNKISNQAKLITIFLFFWVFWLTYNWYNEYKLGTKTVALIFLTLIAFVFGWLLNRRKSQIVILAPSNYYKIIHFFKTIIYINLIVSIASLISIYSRGFNHRDLIFTSAGLFNSVWITLFLNYIIQPLTYAAIIIATITKIEGKKFTRYAYFLLFLMVIQTLGRFPMYYMIYLYVVNKIIDSTISIQLLRKKRNIIFKFLGTLFVISVILYGAWKLQISKMEFEGRGLDASMIIKTYLLNYHVIGFHMLDHFVYSNNINYTFPTTSLGSIGWFLNLITKYSMVLPIFPNSFNELMEIYNNGLFLKTLNMPANAFTTCILPFYADGGFLGVFICFFLIGWFSKSGIQYNIYSANPIFISVVFFMTFSLFMPLISSILWSTVIWIVIINKYLRTKLVIKK